MTKLKAFRINITERCNENCTFCINKKSRLNSDMDFKDIIEVFKYLKLNGIKKIKLLGGEPTLHPDFNKIYNFAQLNFEQIILFTNGTCENELNIAPRTDDVVIYNFNFINSDFNFNRIQNVNNHRIIFEIVISNQFNLNDLKNKITIIKNKLKTNKIAFNLTLDMKCNIIENKTILNKMIIDITEYIANLNYSTFFDHCVPKCFWEKKTLDKLDKFPYFENHAIGKCTVHKSGLIKSNLDLIFCNAYPDKIINIKNKYNEFKDFRELFKELSKKYDSIVNDKLKIDKCNKCKIKNKCLNHCFINSK